MSLDQQVTDALDDGKITETDAYYIRKFAEFLDRVPSPNSPEYKKKFRKFITESEENYEFIFGPRER